MVKKMSVAQAKAELSEVLRLAEQGHSVIIERRGKPVATLRGWRPQDEAPPLHWSQALLGAAADLEEFDEIMMEVLASRGQYPPPPGPNLDD